ncbi:Leucine Rich Repeat family protein [Trichomonas vaginalis G3]|uniref:Leucine Rich Repeat family protein n=1 Tax=Trichomonas vaginalis (strain ATCC PRA-98 / G3) TaxID=412133 RepID=A2ELG9_TRIV3|nr:uncharacterized protein TVAGG3_0005220 [Trichomonas vaginalis G3]EAY06496.1 Leucine Rich Repeat family protein [Trichomonas vaginalis G3]KAI5538869.1 ribonuclease inhibitor domain-containing protein [Trichomonas vaginalis G3]|eukprot:XP_001318719.1 hypothetical protein [Trichomonas vaginalis G3]
MKPFKPSPFGQKYAIEDNPFLMDDISGQENSIVSAIQNPTNCMIYADAGVPSIHIPDKTIPKVIQLVGKGLNIIPIIPTGVKALFISKNSIKNLVPIEQHPTLEIIDASYNIMEVAQIDPPINLKALILASNAITELASTCILSNLQILNLSQNKLTEFNTEICPNLVTLNLSFNQLREFTISSKSLVEISLQNNELTELNVYEADNLSRLDVSNNHFDSVQFVEKIPKLQHFSASGNNLEQFWESYVVSVVKTIVSINKRVLTEGEKAIHNDRVARANKQQQFVPYALISEIRTQFKHVKSTTVQQEETPQDIVSIWLARSREKNQRYRTVEYQSRTIKTYANIDKNRILTVYGPLSSNEYSNKPFRGITLIYTPLQHGSANLNNIVELAKQQPVMLTLNHNMLNTFKDLLFLRFFDTVTILSIDGNLAAKMKLFRPFVAYIMPSINVINGVEVTNLERESGQQHFANVLAVALGLVQEE